MTQRDHRFLTHPPITEALIDIQVSELPAFSQETVKQIQHGVSEHYPDASAHHRIETKLEFGINQPPEASQSSLGLRSVICKARDARQIAQFRTNGFTLNRLTPYQSWEELYPESQRLWREYVAILKPEKVDRIAVRYINHMSFPRGAQTLDKFLTAPIQIPPTLPQYPTNFLTSVALHDRGTDCTVTITQSLEPSLDPTTTVILLDIDAYRYGEWGALDANLDSAFEDLRKLKNRVFFESLTDEALEMFQ